MSVITATQALDMGEAMRKKALGYAAKTGTAIDLAVVVAANAKHEFSLGPIKLYRAIIANLTVDERDELPQPGSRYKNEAGEAVNNADVCLWKDPSKPDGKPKEISFYVVWSDGTPEGSHVVNELEWLSRVSTDGMKTDDIDKTWLAKYVGNTTAIKKRKKYLEGRRATVRKSYKDSVRLMWQLDMVNELDGCVCELGDDDDNVVIVSNKHKPKIEWRLYSVGAFLKLDPLKASEGDGSYASLIATAERAPQQPPGKAPLALNAIATPETSDKVATVWHSYLDKAMSNRGSAEYAALLKHLTSDGGKQAVLTIGDIHAQLGALLRIDTIRAIYEAEKEKVKQAA